MMERNSDQEPTMDASAIDAGDELRVEHRPTRHVGRAIAEARKAKGLSQADLAQSLNLDLRVVELIEAGMFDAAPEPIYIRAYLKSWAGLLDLDADSLIQNYELSIDEQPSDGAQRSRSGKKKLEVMSGSSSAPKRNGGGKFWSWLIWLVLLAIAGLLVAQFLPGQLKNWFGKSSTTPSNQTIVPLEQHAPPSAPAKSSTALPPPNMQQPAASESPLPAKPLAAMPDTQSTAAAGNAEAPKASSETQAGQPAAAASADNQAASTAKTSVSPSALPTDNLVIKAVGADCWVEVKNAAGTRLMYDVLKAGSERRFGGDGPFSVVLGNPNAVQVLWKGKPVKLGSGNATTGVVRVKVGGS